MGRLSDLMEHRRGEFRAYFAGMDLGELAAAPEIKANYEAKNFLMQDEVHISRSVEGIPELHATVKLPLKGIRRILVLLSQYPIGSGELRLVNHSPSQELTLIFPESRLLPVWEFIPGMTGEHRIVVQFSAGINSEGKLFYC